MQAEAGEAVERLSAVLRVLGGFKAQYQQYKGRSALVAPTNPWHAQPAALFGRLDAFLARCHDVLGASSACLAFGRLERAELGGVRGRALTAAVRGVHADFVAAAQRFQQVWRGRVGGWVGGVDGWVGGADGCVGLGGRQRVAIGAPAACMQANGRPPPPPPPP